MKRTEWRDFTPPDRDNPGRSRGGFCRRHSQPHFCISGAATLDQFWNALGSGNLTDGSFARFMVIQRDEDCPEQEPVTDGLNEIAAAVREHSAASPASEFDVGARVVPNSPAVGRRYRELRRQCKKWASTAERNDLASAAPIINRLVENAMKIALISAVSRNREAPEIDETDLELGEAVAFWSGSKMAFEASRRVADTVSEKIRNRVSIIVEKAGKAGIRRSLLVRNSNLSSRELNEAIDTLIEAERIVAGRKNGRKNSAIFYRCAKHGPWGG